MAFDEYVYDWSGTNYMSQLVFRYGQKDGHQCYYLGMLDAT